jgi:hypothetical protein
MVVYGNTVQVPRYIQIYDYLDSTLSIAAHVKFSLYFKTLKVCMVSGLSLDLRNAIVSWPLEKIRSTATADPGIERIS